MGAGLWIYAARQPHLPAIGEEVQDGLKKQQSFVQGAAVLIAANITVKVIGAVFRIPLDQLLGKSGMGLFNVAYVLYATMLVISTAGLPVAVSKMVAESVSLGRAREAKRIALTAGLAFSVIGAAFSALLYCGAEPLSGLVGNPAAAPAVRAIAPSVFCVALISVVRGYFQGRNDMLPTALSQLIEALGKLLLGYGLAYSASTKGLPLQRCAAAAVAGVTIGEAASMLYLLLRVGADRRRREVVLHDYVRPRGVLLRELLVVAVPVTIGSSVMSLTNLLDVALVMNRLQDAGFSVEQANALYGAYSNRAITMFNLPQTVILGLSVSVLPVLSGAFARQNFTQISRTLGAAVRLTLLLALPAGVGYLVLGEPIVDFLFGKDSVSAGEFLRILGFAVPLLALVSLTNAILQAFGKPFAPVKNMLLGGVVKLAGNHFLIGHFGIYGAPVSTVLCYTVIAAGNLLAVRRCTAALPAMREALLPPLMAAIGMGACADMMYHGFAPLMGSNPAVLLAIGTAAVIYVGLLRLLGAMRREDVLLMPRGEWFCSLLRL